MAKRDISIPLSCFLMKCSGCWMAKTDGERRLRKFAIFYTFFMLSFGVYIDISDLCHSLDDINYVLYLVAAFLMTSMAFFKHILLCLNKTRFLQLAKQMRTNFWDIDYDEDEQAYIESTRKFFTFVVLFTCGCTICVLSGYICIPMYETVTGNASERTFPFRMWPVLGVPMYDTPYFEILFIAQALCCTQIGVLFISFDNFLLLVNTHIACQFRILQQRFANLLVTNSELISQPRYADKCYEDLKAFIRQHQMLIEYCRRTEAVFSINILSYVVAFGVGTCMCMYQALLGDISVVRRISFLFYVCGVIFRLILLTHSCGSMITESMNIGPVVYATLWTALPTNKSGRMLRRDIHMIILRSQKPCQLTAGGFFPVSLETSTKLVSTAVSYFTLLQQTSES